MKNISIITVCLNDALGLAKTLASIAGQTAVADLESVVIDGGSTDQTKEIIHKYVDNGLITKWVSEKDAGIYNAMNKGIRLAQGGHCLFLNAGDTLLNNQVIANVLKHKLDKEIVYGNYQRENKLRSFANVNVTLKHFLDSYLPHSASFISRELLNRLGGYIENFKIAGDYEFFLRATLKHKASHKHIPVTIALHQLDGVSNNPKNYQLVVEETERARRLNFSRLYLIFYRRIWKYFVK